MFDMLGVIHILQKISPQFDKGTGDQVTKDKFSFITLVLAADQRSTITLMNSSKVLKSRRIGPREKWPRS